MNTKLAIFDIWHYSNKPSNYLMYSIPFFLELIPYSNKVGWLTLYLTLPNRRVIPNIL